MKVKYIALAIVSLLISGSAMAQKKQTAQQYNGGITSEMMQQMKKGFGGNASDKALRNIMVNNAPNKLAMNYENATKFDSHFSNRVISKAVTDQKSSGRCWMFTGMNVLRNQAIRKHNLPADFQFSQAYLFFYDQLEKSNLFLQAMIDTYKKPMTDQEVEWLFKNPIGDGGQFTGVANLIDKYGLVPADVMPETYNKKTEMLGTIYRMLALTMGEPPAQFTWQQKDAKGEIVETATYTPKEFYEKFAKTDFSKYYMVMNDPTREYYKVYEIQYDRHVYDGQNWRYLNLPMEDIAPMCIASIKDSTMMYFSCDVGKFLNRDNGLMDMNNYDYESLMGTTFGMDKKQRVATFASGSSHAMTLCAVDLDKDGKPVKWMVENSWGPNYGWQGNLIMTNDWFNEYMFRVVLEEKYIPANIRAMMDQQPVMLPAWDPMFAPEE